MGQTVAVDCFACSTRTNVEVPRLGYAAWQAGILIQQAMPGVSIEDRETLISSLCHHCQEQMFTEEEE